MHLCAHFSPYITSKKSLFILLHEYLFPGSHIEVTGGTWGGGSHKRLVERGIGISAEGLRSVQYIDGMRAANTRARGEQSHSVEIGNSRQGGSGNYQFRFCSYVLLFMLDNEHNEYQVCAMMCTYQAFPHLRSSGWKINIYHGIHILMIVKTHVPSK